MKNYVGAKLVLMVDWSRCSNLKRWEGPRVYIGAEYSLHGRVYSDFRLVPKVMDGDGMADMAALLAL